MSPDFAVVAVNFLFAFPVLLFDGLAHFAVVLANLRVIGINFSASLRFFLPDDALKLCRGHAAYHFKTPLDLVHED